MAKKYFIDSENVGDMWVDLFINDTENSEFLVFYTAHTPRIDYEHLIALMNAQKKKPKFLKCYEGSNGLDFQLVTYIGFLLRDAKTDEIIIVSNDTGFDAVVHFWEDFGKKVYRLSPKNLQLAEKKVVQPTVTEPEPVSTGLEREDSSICGIDMEEINLFIYCVGGKEQVSQLSSALKNVYGSEKGSEIYQIMKKRSFEVPPFEMKAQDRFEEFCKIICRYKWPIERKLPKNIRPILYAYLSKNGKKGMSAYLNATCGTEEGASIHLIFKPFYTILERICKQ